MDTLRPINKDAIEEAVRLARQSLALTYPDRTYLPLVVVLPVHRELIRQAKGGNMDADEGLRESLISVIRTIEWPDS